MNTELRDASTPGSSPLRVDTERALMRLLHATSGVTGANFFRALARELAAVFRPRGVILAEILPDGASAQTLAAWMTGELVDAFAYPLAGTPCETLAYRPDCHYPANVRLIFPHVPLFKTLRAESYLGVPVLDGGGKVLGVLELIYGEPTEDSPEARAVLTIFAARAAAELQRGHAEASMRQSRAQLEQRVLRRTHDLQRANAALQAEIAERQRTEGELRNVTRHARCILWHAHVVGRDDWGLWHPERAGQEQTFAWDLRVHNEEAAHQILALDVPAGRTYSDVWVAARHPDDAAAMWRRACEALLAGAKSYAQEFRCFSRVGEVRTFREDARLEQVAPNRWDAFGVVTDITDHKRAEEELRSVASHARCMLWHALVTAPDPWPPPPEQTNGRPAALEWDIRLHHEEAAQALLPLDVPAGSDYFTAWVASRNPADARRMDALASAELAAGSGGYGQDFRCTDRHGAEHWLHEDVYLEPHGPRAWRAFGVVTDVTAAKRAAERDRFHAGILAQMSDAVMGLDADRRINYWNPAAERLYGVPAAEAHGLRSPDVFRHEYLDPDLTDQAVGRLLASHGQWHGRVRHNTRDGRDLFVEVTLSVRHGIYGPAGEPADDGVGFLAVMRDVTAEQRAADALRESQVMFENFMAYNPAIASMKDEQGRYVYINRAIERYTRRTPDEIIGRTDAELWPAPVAEEHRRDDLAVLNSGQALKLQHTTDAPPGGGQIAPDANADPDATTDAADDRRQHWMTYKFPFRDAAGRRFIAGLSLDVTERVRAEHAIRESERHYREAAESNRLLLMELDHRVRNNLNNLLGMLALMRQRTNDVGEFSEALEGRLQAMAHVHQMMAVTGYLPVDLARLVDAFLTAMQGTTSHAVRLVVDGPPVLVEPRQALPLTMIFLEWFTNACKYGAGSVPGGEVRVSWTAAVADVNPKLTCVRLRWQESGGPPVAGAVTPSVGMEVVRGLAGRELGGACTLGFPPGGADHLLEFCADGSPTSGPIRAL